MCMSAISDNIVFNMESRFDDINKVIEKNQALVMKSISDIKMYVCNELKNILDEINQVKVQVSQLQERVDSLERDKVSPDMVITGVPNMKGLNEHQVVLDIFTATGIQNGAALILNVFRPVHSRSSKTPPIIVKFISYQAKILFFKSYMKLGNLNLSHIGFKSSLRIYCNDGLTKYNSSILYEAKILLKEKRLVKATTRKGLVHIVLPGETTSIVIKSIESLNALIDDHQHKIAYDKSNPSINKPLQQQREISASSSSSSVVIIDNNKPSDAAINATTLSTTGKNNNKTDCPKPVLSSSSIMTKLDPTLPSSGDKNKTKTDIPQPTLASSSIMSKLDSFVDEVIDDCSSVTFRKLRSNSKSN